MRAEPFDAGDADAARRFVSELLEILKARPDLSLQPAADSRQVTRTMDATRGRPFEERRRLYIDERVADQSDWYSRRASDHRRRGRLWFWVGVIAELLAILFGLLRVMYPDAINLIGFLTAVAAGATAISQLHQHDELSRSYGLASQELSSIRTLIERCTEAEFAELVRDSEGAVSREHTMWVAKRT